MSTNWVRLWLDLDAFDEAPFTTYLDLARERGLLLTTLGEEGDVPEHRRCLYDLNRVCSADIPGREGFYSYEEYVSERLEGAGYDADGVVLALDGDQWVAFSGISLAPGAPIAVNEMTGVLPPYRGAGLAMACKLVGIRYARRAGARWLRTLNHPDNTGILAVNRKLGFTLRGPA